MATSTGKYLGQLRTENTHKGSGQQIITDAPVDNNGKGEAFSPTDLVCAALGSCMVTIMGILANRENIDLSELSWSVTKHMAANPRRISKIEVEMNWPGAQNYDASTHRKVKKAARTCPVALSLHPDVVQEYTFNF